VWDVQQDTVQFFDFYTGKNDMASSADPETVPVKKLVYCCLIAVGVDMALNCYGR